MPFFFPKIAQSRESRERLVDSNRRLSSSVDSSFSDSSEDQELDQMATDPDVIFKALRLVPEFDGNPNILTRFIRICDQVQTAYGREGDPLGNLCLINGILNKITGSAARTINANRIPDDWAGIKNVLINNFSDQRDETALYNDLAVQVQGQNTPQEFYDKCQTLFSTIMMYVTLHETVATTVQAKKQLYKKLTMQSFVRGLKEPLGSRIRCMRPETVEKALEFVQEEMNTIYLQQRNDSLTHPKPHATQPNVRPLQNPTTSFTSATTPKPFTFGHQMMRNFQPRPQMSPQFKFHAQCVQPQYQPSYGMPSRTQQMFRALPPNYNPRSNVFRLPPRPQTGPQPMSGVSHFAPRPLPPTSTGQNWRNPGNQHTNNYFKPSDVNVNDCTNYSNPNDYDNYYYADYVQDNFYSDPYDNYYDGYNCMYDPYYQDPQQTTGINCIPDGTQLEIDSQPQPSSSEREDFQKAKTSRKPK